MSTMTKSEHTPGPWKTVNNPNGDCEILIMSEHGDVGAVGWETSVAPGERAQANASLIATSPELLELAEDWHTALIETGKVERAAQVDRVIAKARGETT